MGYKVIGINGWKPLCGQLGYVKGRPDWFWIVVSDLTQLIVRNRPKHAFHLLFVKEKAS